MEAPVLSDAEIVDILQARIDEGRAVIAKFEEAIAAIRAQKPLAAPAPRLGVLALKNGRRIPVAAGSPGARVLSLCDDPISLPAIVRQAEAIGLRAGTVRVFVDRLVASGHLTRTGKSRATRYVAK